MNEIIADPVQGCQITKFFHIKRRDQVALDNGVQEKRATSDVNKH